MRLLVISDSHGHIGTLDGILREQPTAREVFFLGDCVSDLETLLPIYPDRSFHIVSGNGDWYSSYPAFDQVTVGGVSVFYTHGHRFEVAAGSSRLTAFAAGAGCQIALYGHTHIPSVSYEGGVYTVNPGSCARSRSGPNSYAIIDLLDGGILPAILTVS